MVEMIKGVKDLLWLLLALCLLFCFLPVAVLSQLRMDAAVAENEDDPDRIWADGCFPTASRGLNGMVEMIKEVKDTLRSLLA